MNPTEPTTAASALPRSTPEEQGIPSDAVLRMVRRWEREGNEPHGVVVLRHGHVVAEGAWRPWPRDGIRLVYSVSKTFLAIAAAFAEAEGLLARDERLVDVFPEAADAAGPRAARVTVEDCLRMSTGHHADTLDGFLGRGEESVAVFLAAEPEEEPGSWFLYHNGASRVLALAVQRRTGERLVDYLRPRLLDPLGVERGGVDRLGRNRSRLQRAAHQHRHHRPARPAAAATTAGGRAPAAAGGWVATASSPLADTTHHPDPADWKAGYGYQMWRNRAEGFRADGAYGQFALVLPEHDLVVAVTSCTETTHEVLDAVWEELLPPPRRRNRCRPTREAHARLVAALDTAAAPAPGSTAAAARRTRALDLHAHPDAEHPALRSVEVRPGEQGWVLEVDDGERLTIPCGDGHWPDAGGVALGRQRRLGGARRVRGDGRRPRDPALAAAALRGRHGDGALARRPAARPRPGPAAAPRG